MTRRDALWALAEVADAIESLPDQIAVFRVIKRSKARKHGEIAKAVADDLERQFGHIPALARALIAQECAGVTQLYTKQLEAK